MRATFRAANGRECSGFVTPAPADASHDLGLIQPHLAVAGRFFGFWGGTSGVDSAAKSAFYAAFGAPPAQIFPITFSCSPQLTSGRCSALIAGFYRSLRAGEHIVEL